MDVAAGVVALHRGDALADRVDWRGTFGGLARVYRWNTRDEERNESEELLHAYSVALAQRAVETSSTGDPC